MSIFCKNPCKLCPFRKDVNFHFSPERAAELANHTKHPLNYFHCHKTLDYGEDNDGEGTQTRKSKLCAGFMTLQAKETGVRYEGFTPSSDKIYDSANDMIERYSK